MDENLYKQLKAVWNQQDQYVIYGGQTYEVYTPNGVEEPVFAAKSDQGMYGSTSFQTSDPKPLLNRATPKKKRHSTFTEIHSDLESEKEE